MTLRPESGPKHNREHNPEHNREHNLDHTARFNEFSRNAQLNYRRRYGGHDPRSPLPIMMNTLTNSNNLNNYGTLNDDPPPSYSENIHNISRPRRRRLPRIPEESSNQNNVGGVEDTENEGSCLGKYFNFNCCVIL